jgi:hypothetical protein
MEQALFTPGSSAPPSAASGRGLEAGRGRGAPAAAASAPGVWERMTLGVRRMFSRGLGRISDVEGGSAKRPALALHSIEENEASRHRSESRARSNSRPPPSEPPPSEVELQCAPCQEGAGRSPGL